MATDLHLLLFSLAISLLASGGGSSKEDVMCLEVNHSALLLEPSSRCVDLLKDFADVHSDYVKCVLTYAHPTCMCEACWQHHQQLKRVWDTVSDYDTNATKSNGNFSNQVSGHHCTRALLYGSKLNLLKQSYLFAENLWDEAACKYCIKNCSTKVSCNVSILTDDARMFYEKLENVTTCMGRVKVISEEVSQGTRSPSPSELGVSGSKLNSSEVCSVCRESYRALLDTYKKLRDDAEKMGRTVCADIQDHINKTRLQWGRVYGCEKRTVNTWLVVGLGLSSCLFPILFYVGAKVCGVYSERREANTVREPVAPSPVKSRKTFPSYGATNIQRRRANTTS